MKGLSGYIISLVITLVLAAIGLVIFWLFLKNVSSGAKDFADKLLDNLCQSIGVLKYLIGC
ncbi:MAG: hypothetical protein QXJ06_00400 [Candidatus Aenigmatarchaeota archaeon]